MKFYTRNSESLRESLRSLGFNHVFNNKSRSGSTGKAISAAACTWLGVDVKTRRYFSVDGDDHGIHIDFIEGRDDLLNKVRGYLDAAEKAADELFGPIVKEIPVSLPEMPEGVTEVVFKGKRYKQVTTWVEVKE